MKPHEEEFAEWGDWQSKKTVSGSVSSRGRHFDDWRSPSTISPCAYQIEPYQRDEIESLPEEGFTIILPASPDMPTGEEKTEYSEESETLANGSKAPWNHGAGGNESQSDGVRSRRSLEMLDASYRVHISKEFKCGRVFKVLWAEPAGTKGTSRMSADNRSCIETGDNYTSIRRFVVFANDRSGCNVCLPISTYARQGTMKGPMSAHSHAIIYASNSPSIIKTPWRKHTQESTVASIDEHERISRLDYAKIYTVENNMKACFIGSTNGNTIDHDTQQIHSNGEENNELFLISGHEYWRCCKCKDGRCSYFKRFKDIANLPWVLAGLGMSSSLLMGASFLWLDKRMELTQTSSSIDWIVSTAGRELPVAALDALSLVPDGVIFVVFGFATAVLAGSSWAWITNTTQHPMAKIIGWAVVAIIAVSSIFAAVTVEEYFLVCLPLSVGLGILSSCWPRRISNSDAGQDKFECEV